jgi:predicted cobalt transporter CbtA
MLMVEGELKENSQMRTGRCHGHLAVSPAPTLRVSGAAVAHSDEKLEPINGYQRVNRDFASKERLLVLHSFVNERYRHVRETKDGTGGRTHG